VLPLQGSEGWGEGLRLLLRHYTNQADRYLNTLFTPRTRPKRKSRRGSKKKPVADPLALPASFAILNAGILKSHQVLALGKRNQYLRPVGPGFTLLYRKEKPTHLIDLRKQLRRQLVKANTRDGIPIETNVIVVFRVRQALIELLGPEPYPYDKDAIFHLCYVNSIDAYDTVHDWSEQVAPRAAALLVNEINHYTLDELYTPGNGGLGPLDQIKNRIKQALERQLDQSGIEILVVGLAPFTLPPAVAEQRIKTWQADWQRLILIQQAAGSAESVRRMKNARARAQIEIIKNITQNIDQVRRANEAELSNIITLRMIEALEEAKSNRSLQSLIPQQVLTNLVMNTSKQMQKWLDQNCFDYLVLDFYAQPGTSEWPAGFVGVVANGRSLYPPTAPTYPNI
ncbi:MAG: SPFH domain-containing protein, partial [Anaerolineae bacterium]